MQNQETTSQTPTTPDAPAFDATDVAAALLSRGSVEADEAPAAGESAAIGETETLRHDAEDAGDANAEDAAGIEIPTGFEDEVEAGDEDGAAVDDDAEGDEPEADAEQERKPGDWPESARKRVDKLTAQKRELSAQLEQLRAEREQLRQELDGKLDAAIPADVPLPKVKNWAEYRETETSAREALAWLIANPYGGEVRTADGEVKRLTAEDVAERRVHVETVLNVQLPQRREWLQRHAEVNAEAAKVYKQLFVDKTPQSALAHQVIAEYPSLRAHPDYVMVVGDILVGRAVREGHAMLVPKKSSKPPGSAAAKAPEKRPPMVPSPGSGAVPKGRPKGEASTQRFLATGSVADLTSVLEYRLG